MVAGNLRNACHRPGRRIAGESAYAYTQPGNPHGEALLCRQRAWYSRRQGMLAWIRISRALHRSAAVCLAFLLSFASLAPVAAQALNARAAAMACCRTKAKGCCPRNHASTGPAFSARSCSGDCCPLPAGVSVRGAAGLPRYAMWTPVVHPAAGSSDARFCPFTLLSSHSLRQRPPPIHLSL